MGGMDRCCRRHQWANGNIPCPHCLPSYTWRRKQYVFLKRRSVPTRLWIHIQEDIFLRISVVFLMWGTEITEMRDSSITIKMTVSLSHFRMPIKMQVFWIITSWILAYNFRNVEGTCCSHLQSSLRVLWRRKQQESSPNSRISCYKSIRTFTRFRSTLLRTSGNCNLPRFLT